MGSKLLRRSGYACVEILNKHNWKPDAVFHVGVGIHHQEIDVMKEVWGDNVTYHATEPHPKVAKGLATKNNEDGFPYFNDFWEVAIGKEEGTRTFYAKNSHKDGSSLFKHERDEHNDNPIQVEVTTLDHLFKSRSSNHFGESVLLWLDCEGSELDALQGGRMFLDKVKAVNVELTGEPRGPDWCEPADVHEFLYQRGFWPIWLHTIRGCIGQYDMVFLREELIDERYCAFPKGVYGVYE